MTRGTIRQKTGLGKSQGDGQICPHAGIENLTRRGFQTTRKVNGNRESPFGAHGIQFPDTFRDIPKGGSLGPDSEQSVDDDQSSTSSIRQGIGYTDFDCFKMSPGQRCQFWDRNGYANINLPTGFLKMTGSNKSVSAVVSLATKDDRSSRIGKKLPDARRNSLARDLHKPLGSGPGGKSGFFRRFHLDGRQNHVPLLILHPSPPSHQTFLASGNRKRFITQFQDPEQDLLDQVVRT
jgi:hypothetical protein